MASGMIPDTSSLFHIHVAGLPCQRDLFNLGLHIGILLNSIKRSEVLFDMVVCLLRHFAPYASGWELL